MGAFSAEAPTSAIKSFCDKILPAVEEGGERRGEKGDRSDVYARHGLKGKESKGGCVVMDPIWQYLMTCNAEVM